MLGWDAGLAILTTFSVRKCHSLDLRRIDQLWFLAVRLTVLDQLEEFKLTRASRAPIDRNEHHEQFTDRITYNR
jgi:hypothetical protein